MWYAMAYFPELNHPGLNQFRHKYDPTSQMIKEHLPVLMPIPGTIKMETLSAHLTAILNQWEPFDIHLQDLLKSWDHWLFLRVKKGYNRIIKLHDEIYTGILKPFLRTDLPFEPHIGLGLFASGDYDYADPQKVPLHEEKYAEAYQKAVDLHLDFRCTVNSFDLILFNDSFTRLQMKRKFILTRN